MTGLAMARSTSETETEGGAAALGAADDTLLCPSAACTKKNLLLGFVRDDGKVERFSNPANVDQDLVHTVARHPWVRDRLRFVGNCAAAGCKNWSDGKCSVVRLAVAAAKDVGLLDNAENLPPCSIRGKCRWFREQSHAACRACVYVKSEIRRDTAC